MLFDMPLEQLLRYQGCSPRPSDAAFDKISSTDKDYIIWHDFRHEELPRSSDLLYMYMMEMN